jgi:hypothetical protein
MIYRSGILEAQGPSHTPRNPAGPESQSNFALLRGLTPFTDIDGIVRQVRFDGWQTTTQGEREVQQALRRALLKYKLHTDQELFDKAYGYIRQYY